MENMVDERNEDLFFSFEILTWWNVVVPQMKLRLMGDEKYV
jgi:hypothetical protein